MVRASPTEALIKRRPLKNDFLARARPNQPLQQRRKKRARAKNHPARGEELHRALVILGARYRARD